jgi:hypothetical protein
VTVEPNVEQSNEALTHVRFNAMLYKVTQARNIAEIPSPSRYMGMGRLINPTVFDFNAATAALYQTLDGYFSLK